MASSVGVVSSSTSPVSAPRWTSWSARRDPDLLLVNDDDLTFAKIRLDDRSRETVVRSIGRLSSSLARALCWTATTDMLRDAELPARDYVELVLGGVQRETDISVVQTVLAAGRTAIDLYADPLDRMMLSARWASGLRRLAGVMAAGSDSQLAIYPGLGGGCRQPRARRPALVLAGHHRRRGDPARPPGRHGPALEPAAPAGHHRSRRRRPHRRRTRSRRHSDRAPSGCLCAGCASHRAGQSRRLGTDGGVRRATQCPRARDRPTASTNPSSAN